MKSSHFYYIILFSFLLAACKDDGPGEKENSDNDVPSVATNTWLLNSLDNIENYSNSDPENRYDINMVRNEYESVQLVIQTDSKKSLKIERIGNNDAIEFQCRKLEAFNGKYDVLIPCDNEIEPDDKVVRAWLTFKVRSEAEAKRHKEIIRFKTDDKEYAVAISINVVNASLPETPSIASVFGINPQNFIFTGLSEEQKIEKRKAASDLLLEYRISPYFSTWLSGTMKTECFSSPYAWNDDRTWEYLADKRFSRIALPSHGLSDDELEMMLNKARETGLLNKAFFYVWDEPTKTNEYEQIKTLSDRIHRYAPEAKVLTTFYCGPTDGEHKDDLFAVFDILNGATSIYCTGVWALQDNENRSEQCKAKLKSGKNGGATCACLTLRGLLQILPLSVTGRPCGVIIKNKIPDSYIGSSTDSPAFIPSDLALNCPKETGYSSIPANRSAQTKFVPLSGWNDGAMEPKITTCWSCTKKNSDDRPPYLFSTTSIRVPRTTQIKANTHWLYVKI